MYFFMKVFFLSGDSGFLHQQKQTATKYHVRAESVNKHQTINQLINVISLHTKYLSDVKIYR